ncbi:hypothetical protein SAY87_008910 [Trapa incisa]|uniref:RING-type E3 ubiquitin transferase BRCA1 n=1 Tax=Trapa incisa TaxID=236973 RepID=A0AAN7K0W2_9MYRT|nr:hypothetical protein SAY87_008910 [Trapa incisa]
MEGDEDSSFDQLLRHDTVAVRPIKGMESVVATVSGYKGTERFNLIKLISLAGANYVGAMSSSITHLICWNFEGKKYNLSRKFKTIAVNHQWIEDCTREKKRLPEGPYMLKSGQEVGHLGMQFPVDYEAGNKKPRVLSNKSNFSLDSVSIQGASVSEYIWTDSILLKKELIQSSREEKKRFSTFKKSNCYPSLCSARKENCPSHGDGSSSGYSHRRRLVKKNIIRETPKIVLSDSEDDCCVMEPRNKSCSIKGSPCNMDAVDNVEKLATDISLDDAPSDHQGKTNLTLRVGEIENRNRQSVSRDYSLNSSSATVGISSKDESHCAKNLSVEISDMNEADYASKLPATSDLSCVICWTDFSSTRGVLPCGHRFCFTCIRDWAENMASMKRGSTCPLCKTSFMSITIVEDAACSDQKIYSQTIPHAQSTTDIYVLPDQQNLSSLDQLHTEPVCIVCRSREPTDMLISCEVCRILCIHSYCLDPPLLPWTCVHCRNPRISRYWTR